MSEFWGRVTPKFAHVLDRIPRLMDQGFSELRGGELLAIRTSEGWIIRAEDDPSLVNPRLETIYLSKGRGTEEPGLAFEAVDRLSRVLYNTPSDPNEKAKGAVLVAATWYFPEWDWYINQPRAERDNVGILTTRGMWGAIAGYDHQAQGVVVVCAAGSVRRSKEHQLKIRQGGFPGPKDWSPRGRLPGDY